MMEKSKSGLMFYQFSHFLKFPEVRHGFFTRIGGKSATPFDSLNISRDVGDETDSVVANREKVLHFLGGEKMVSARQVHGKTVVSLLRSDGKGPVHTDGNPPECDGFISDIPGQFILIQTADCQPVFLYDPKKRVVAGIHSGWKGSVQDIAGHTVKTMAERCGSDPADIVAGIGPSLGPCCSEFVNYRSELPEEFRSYKNDDDCFDFWRITTHQLVSAGVLEDNIKLARMCTKCRQDLFFSYRGRRETGRMASVIGLV